MSDYETIDALNILDPGIEFDPTNWEDRTVLILLILLTVGGIIYVVYQGQHRQDKPTHYYNRKTGKVEEMNK